MQKYDVVLLVDANISENDRRQMIEEFEKDIKKIIVEKDDIGLQKLAYNLKNKPGNDKVYVYSYYVEANNEDLDIIKKSLLYNKIIKRYFIFKMKPNQEFLKFAKVNEELNAIIDSWDVKKIGQKVLFFVDKKNEKYINRKSIAMLKKYVTRFGNIKPRKYTNNLVTIQKKLRIAILRARELGFLEYVK